MGSYVVRLKGGKVDVVTDANTHQQEGPGPHHVLSDPAGTQRHRLLGSRTAGYRTADIIRIRYDHTRQSRAS